MKLEYFSCVICALLLLTLHKTNSLKTTLGDNGCWYDVFTVPNASYWCNSIVCFI